MSLKEAARSIPFKQGFLFVCFVGSILALSMLFLSGQGNIGAGAAHLGDEAQEHHH